MVDGIGIGVVFIGGWIRLGVGDFENSVIIREANFFFI
jgi:hypothetical protein